MKEWWNNLILREKQILCLGIIIAIAAFIYLILWSPLHNRVSHLRLQIKNAQHLLAAMQAIDKQIQHTENTTQVNIESGSLLNLVQKQIKASPLVKALDQLRQTENDAVLLSFKQVDFDKLIAWLMIFSQQYRITLTQMSVTPGTTPGMVAAEVTLAK